VKCLCWLAKLVPVFLFLSHSVFFCSSIFYEYCPLFLVLVFLVSKYFYPSIPFFPFSLAGATDISTSHKLKV